MPKVVLNTDSIEVAEGDFGVRVEAERITKMLQEVVPPSSGLLQPALRWISPSMHTVILERPPFVARIGYRPGRAGRYAEGQAQEYLLPVPWQVYGLHFDPGFSAVREMFLFVRNTPVFSEEDSLHFFPYPNVFNNMQVCLGDGFFQNYMAAPPSCLSDALSAATNAFWTADFNEDAGPASWTEPWRSPVQHFTRRTREYIEAGEPNAQAILTEYANTPLQDLVTWGFPRSNVFNPDGDRFADLIAKLQEVDTMAPFSDYEHFWAFAREIHARAQRPVKKRR